LWVNEEAIPAGEASQYKLAGTRLCESLNAFSGGVDRVSAATPQKGAGFRVDPENIERGNHRWRPARPVCGRVTKPAPGGTPRRCNNAHGITPKLNTQGPRTLNRRARGRKAWFPNRR